MTHNTQIRKKVSVDFDSILNVGRNVNGGIYIDVQIYHHGDVVETGDITITQAEFDEINTNLEQSDVKLFICPECGTIVSESDILEDLTSGCGYGMCTCKFGNGQRILVRYEPYTEDMQVTSNEERLIEIIRGLSG